MGKAAVAGKLDAEGRCRLCRRSKRVRPLTRHRLVPGRVGGRYEWANVIPLCRPCHDLVDHRDPDERRRARRMLRASLWPVEVAYARAHVGWRRVEPFGVRIVWDFDAAYPPPPRELVLERRREASAVTSAEVGSTIPGSM